MYTCACVLHGSSGVVLTPGKFKGKANDFDLSLDDLVELLHSVDHHKVVDSRDAVISDEQLEALLDRTLTCQEKKKETESSTSSGCSAGDQSLFRVIEERDAKGNVIREDDSASTTDTWHIVANNNTSESQTVIEGGTETVANSSESPTDGINTDNKDSTVCDLGSIATTENNSCKDPESGPESTTSPPAIIMNEA